jgi:N-ethylmaleimide reductase
MSTAANTCSERAPKDPIVTDLFNSFDLKGLPLSNRIVMSAMTRTRATEDDVPTDMMRDYYVQRASAGLIVTECTQVSTQAHGIIRAPGLHRADQIAAWRGITMRCTPPADAFTARFGTADASPIRTCAAASSRSGLRLSQQQAISFYSSGRVEFPVPRELKIEELARHRRGVRPSDAERAPGRLRRRRTARANGYLQDQFLEDGSNHRTDAYGGAVENRARLMLETATAMINAWSADRIGVRCPHPVTFMAWTTAINSKPSALSSVRSMRFGWAISAFSSLMQRMRSAESRSATSPRPSVQ